MRVIGHRAAEAEFRSLGRTVENAPVTPGRAFARALPGLVERLDDVDPEILALAERQSLFDGAGLVRRRRQRALAHAAVARPTELADDDLPVWNRSEERR